MSQMTWHTCSDILHRALVCGVKKEGREAWRGGVGVLCAGECGGERRRMSPVEAVWAAGVHMDHPGSRDLRIGSRDSILQGGSLLGPSCLWKAEQGEAPPFNPVKDMGS